eukprot:1139503-Pelagomonas_calceolata.AAC.3
MDCKVYDNLKPGFTVQGYGLPTLDSQWEHEENMPIMCSSCPPLQSLLKAAIISPHSESHGGWSSAARWALSASTASYIHCPGFSCSTS